MKLIEFLLHPPQWMQPPGWMVLILWASFAYVVVKLVLVLFPMVPLYIRARMLGVRLGWFDLFGIRLRNGVAATRKIVEALIIAKSDRLDVSPVDVEALHLAQGNAINTVIALGWARKADVPLTWKEASALELMGLGKELSEAVPAAKNSKDTARLDELRSRLTAAA